MKQSSSKNASSYFNRSFLWKVFFFVAAILPLQLSAQKKIATTPINKSSVASLSKTFKNYSVFSVDAPALAAHARLNAKKTMDVEFDFAGISPMRMELEENDILTNDYKLIVGSPSGEQVFNKPAVMTYKGKLANDNNSKIYLTITEQTVFGVIRGKGKEYYIEPLRYFSKDAAPGAFVVYEANDVIPNSGMTCGSTEAAERTPQLENNLNLRATGTCRMVEVAIASDYSMVSRYISPAIIQERNIGIMNLMVGIFHEAQIGTQYLEFKIAGQYIAASPATNPFLPNYDGFDASILLTNFRGWGQSGRFGFGYDMAQLWTTKNIATLSAGVYSYGVIGLASVEGICGSYRYQVLEDFNASSLAKAALAGHETGHNLGYVHDPEGSPTIMAPSLMDPPYTIFSSTSLTVINNYINGPGGSCLSSCNQSPIAQFSSSATAICTGNTVTFTDYSVGNVSARNWQFGPGANPATSTAEVVNVTYSTPGVKEITLSAYNAINSATIKKNIVVSAAPLNCRVAGPNSDNYGILAAFKLGNINMSKSMIYINSGEYEDKSCSDITELVPGATYTATASIGTQHMFPDYIIPTKLQVMLDYNNDGDFSDANESIYYTPECTEAVIQFPITIPQVLPVLNSFLRLRVMAIPCSLDATDGCTIPIKSQVHDFSVYFLCTNTYYRDLDVDLFGDPNNSVVACSQPLGYVSNNTDCNDNNPGINPLTQWIIDNDQDGYYTGSPVTRCTSPGAAYIIKTTQQPGDCNDNNRFINPLTQWILDNDQDGYYPGSAVVQCTSPGTAYIIKTTQQAGDCNDNDPAVNAGTTEVCANGKDDNCNGVVDENVCAPCANATGLTTTNITTTSAKLNWVAVANPLIWEVRYKKTSQGTQWITLPQLTGNIRSVTISSLSSNSSYNWQIRAKCGNAWTKYTDVAVFITSSTLNIEEIITGTKRNETNEIGELTVGAMPNPSHTSFTINVTSFNKKDRIMIQVVDVAGRIIETRSINADQVIQLGEKYKEGIYIVRLLQDKQVKQIKLVKLPG